jgi:acyl-CoA reductase-like NAD-dependent aldehyde dehydrogenase
MICALVLIDLQQDFLACPGLQPTAGYVIDAASRLLHGCRRLRVPVIHVFTSTDREPDNRMPHWRAANKRICELSSPGHKPPVELQPLAGEPIIHKQFFSGFGTSRLGDLLKSIKCDRLLLAGVHLHGCVRATALDAYARHYDVWIADDANASDDPIHSAITRRYLSTRGATFASVAGILQTLEPLAGAGAAAASVPPLSPVCRAKQIDVAQKAQASWRHIEPEERASVIRRAAQLLREDADVLAKQITHDIGKPISMARAEIDRSVALLHAAERTADLIQCQSGPGASYRYQPLGVVAVITPWNNPVAIPLGKIAPAIMYGNTVIWKPSPPATDVSRRLMDIFRRATWCIGKEDLISLVVGDKAVASALASDERIDGVTLSGSLRAGHALQEICARRHVPFQGELGGNNAAIVWEDANITQAALQIAAGAFGFAGQRCTANRRVIVAEKIFTRFLDRLAAETAALRWDDPFNEATVIGPMIDFESRDAVTALLRRTEASPGMKILIPHRQRPDYEQLIQSGPYQPPAIVIADDEHHEIVQEETFGPVVVVQRARSFDEAIGLLNGVRQGLIAAIFTFSEPLQARFLDEARAGVLKINRSTVDADATSPLGGWKASGIGPAEHGPCDREFFCRVQTIYRA